MVKIECVVEAGNYLGEGPVWDPVEGVLYWVDMLDKEVWRLDPRTGKTHTWTLPKTVGAFALREQGGGVLTMRDGFYFMDLDSGETELIALVDADEPRSLFNDGKVDRRGRFFAPRQRHPQGTTILTGGSVGLAKSEKTESDCVDQSVPIAAARQNIEEWTERTRLARVKRAAAQKALNKAQREQDKVQRDIAEERESLEREAFRRGRTPPPLSFVRLGILLTSHLKMETPTNELATEVLRAESAVEHAESMLQQNKAKLRELLARQAECTDQNKPRR